jgi:hypothetical protein
MICVCFLSPCLFLIGGSDPAARQNLKSSAAPLNPVACKTDDPDAKADQIAQGKKD